MSLRQLLLNNYNDIIYDPGKCFRYYQIMNERFSKHNGRVGALPAALDQNHRGAFWKLARYF
jgi:hypothetical protein